MRFSLTYYVLLPAAVAAVAPAAAQVGGGEGDWNDPRVLELVERGVEARRTARMDDALQSYRALTEGHIYFFVDPEEGERALIRLDQVAVELFWEAPDRVRQRVVGERSETRLPVRDFRYYLDRLTLVQYGFADEIQVGHGMDVAGVPHPLAGAARGASGPYDFRLADSVSLSFPGATEPLTVYEVEVRPRDPADPGVVGSIFLSRRDAQLVRMAFTFTPASYVDRRTDRIAVELDYGLWEGRHWLPNRQLIEVRRELPELDIGVGTVIRAVLRVGNYELNVPIPPVILMGPRVSRLPDEARDSYDFPEGLYAGIERDGLGDVATRVDPRELRARAAELLRNRPPTGLSPVRLHLPAASSLVSYDRARGLELGVGASFRPAGTTRLRIAGGWAFAPGRPRASLHLDGVPASSWVLDGRAVWDVREELGAARGIAPALGSLGALVRGEDYLDPFRVSGAAIGAARELARGSRVRVEVGLERHRSETLHVETAPLDAGREFRGVLPVAEATFAVMGASWLEPIPAGPLGSRGRAGLEARLLGGEPGWGGRIDAQAELLWRTPGGARDARVLGRAGALVGEPLPQLHRLIGGRGTVPGFPYRSFGGRAHGVATAEGAVDMASPWVRARAGLHAGWTDGRTPETWDVPGTSGIRVGATAGIGLFFDLLRIDGARGINGGEWQLLLSVDPMWWDRL